jgi:hypothetical protein
MQNSKTEYFPTLQFELDMAEIKGVMPVKTGIQDLGAMKIAR